MKNKTANTTKNRGKENTKNQTSTYGNSTTKGGENGFFLSLLKRDYKLLKYEEIPDFMKFNLFIRTGYRPNLSLKQTISSFFHMHNESLNVWSHFGGALLFGILLITAFTSWILEGEFLDHSVFFTFTISAIIVLLCSTSFHLFQPFAKSSEEYSLLSRLDYVGISVLIVGSYYAPIYYLFYCQPYVAIFYTGGVTILAGCAIALTFSPTFDLPGYELFRASVFMLMGWFGVTSAPHAIYLFGFSQVWPILWRVGVMGLLYSIGVFFYVTRIPERFYPGRFDFGLNSHVIWHFFVISAALATYQICTYCFHNRFSLPCFEIYDIPLYNNPSSSPSLSSS